MRTFTSTQPARVLGIVAFGLLACMYITPNAWGQNVGIGTAAPTARLHVNGTLRVGAYTLPATDGFGGQVLRTNGAGTLTWGYAASDLHTAYLAGPSITTNTTDGPVLIAGNQGIVVQGVYNSGSIGLPPSVPLASTVFSFISGKAAFRGGRRLALTDWDPAQLGVFSFAYGDGVIASGAYSVAMGNQANASNPGAISMGYWTQATGNSSISMGNSTIASGTGSVAIGLNSDATSNYAIAMGNNCLSSGLYSFSSGQNLIASGSNSLAMGLRDTAQGDYSVAIGRNQIAAGTDAIAFGRENTATGDNTVAIGNYHTLAGNGSVAIGGGITINGINSRGLGYGLLVPGTAETVLGNYNTDYVPTGTINDRLFCIGSGSNNAARANAMVILKSERVGLGVNTPAYRLDLPNFASSLGQGRANAWLTYSDGRVKTGNRPIPYGLQTVMALRPQQYEHHSSTFENGQLVLDAAGPAATRIGFVAQDLARVVPEAATAPADAETDLWAVDYTALVPVLVRALQEQQAQIEALQATVNQQATQLQHLSAQRP